MGAKTFMPVCQVTIAGIDITPYLSDGGTVTTTKDLYAPKGRWSVAIADTPGTAADGVIDSLYGQIAPMDRAEIRLARNAADYPWGKPPVVMRGFVRAVIRDERIDESGRPARLLHIEGDDYGCIGEIIQINLLHAAALNQQVLAILRPAELGITHAILPANAYMEALLGVMNDHLQEMTVETGDAEAIKEIGFDGQVTTGQVVSTVLTTTEGTLWKIMFDQADTPWNELYIEDRSAALGDGADGPFLVYRPTPWKDLDGNFIANTGASIDAARVRQVYPDKDADGEPEFRLVRQATYRRSDEQVNNVFWVVARALFMDPQQALGNALDNNDPSVDFTGYEHANKDIFGARPLTLTSTQSPVGTLYHPETGGAGRLENRNAIEDWVKQRRQWASDANKDNVLRDDGELVVRGNEKLRIGSYYQIDRGRFSCDHYLTQVSHTFAPFGEFTTHVTFIRANNYYRRHQMRQTGQSPFFAEGRKGVLET